MAGNIKGILIEIGGDTSGLQKALSKVNSATSSLNKELKGVNSLLKLDPGNTDLLNQKQEVLAKNIQQTSEKLKILKEVQEEVESAIANGTKVSDDKYRSLQREIINTENKLKDLQVQASKWTTAGKATEEFGKKVDSIGSKVDSLGNKLTTRVTAPLIALGVVGVNSAAKQEAAMQQVEKIYGDAAGTIKNFAEKTAISFNMSTSDAYKYAQIYGNLIQSITDDQAENAQYTQQLLESSSVIASATGRTMEDVMDRIRSGLLGNTEAIEDLGINVNVAMIESTDAFKRFAGDKSWKQLDFQTQQQIRLFAILEQTTKKYGNEVNKNTASDVQKLTAKFTNLTSKLRKKLLPTADKLIDKADDFLDKLDDLTDEEMENIVQIGLIVAAAGPLLKILGTTGKVLGSTVKGVGIFSQAIAVATNKTTSSVKSVNNLAKAFGVITSPAGLASIGVGLAVTSILIAVNNAEKATKEAFSNMGNSANDFITGINKATSHLDSFNSTLFASSEEQQKLQEDMDNIQQGITEICKKASDERRGYTQEEITQLDEYFTKLRDLKNRELEIQKSISNSIVQQATQNAQTFQGNLTEYKINSQEWIKTAEEQTQKEIQIINDRTTQEIALLQQRFGDKATIENEEYAREYNSIVQQKDKAIQEANDQVAKVNLAYANGYLQRTEQNNGFYTIFQQYNQKVEDETNRHNQKIQEIEDGNFNKILGRTNERQGEAVKHNDNMKSIWNDMYKNMSEEQEKELGIWLAMVAQTEMYGGKIDDKTKDTVNKIIESYNSMPSKTQEAMKNAMDPMLEEMEKKEPSLFAKATGIADGILSRLKKSFDIHSPSRKMRKIFKNVMISPEEEMEKGRKILNEKAKTIATDILKRFNGMSFDFDFKGIDSKVIEKSKTIFTTPQITFNVQELDEARLEQCFNYINKKFGSQY